MEEWTTVSTLWPSWVNLDKTLQIQPISSLLFTCSNEMKSLLSRLFSRPSCHHLKGFCWICSQKITPACAGDWWPSLTEGWRGSWDPHLRIQASVSSDVCDLVLIASGLGVLGEAACYRQGRTRGGASTYKACLGKAFLCAIWSRWGLTLL